MEGDRVGDLRRLGNKKFREQNYGASVMYYTQALDLDPESFALYYNRSVAFVKMDAIEDAMNDLRKSLDINPHYIPSLCQLGFLYLYEGDTPKSLELYVKIVKLNMTLPHQLNRFKAQLKESIRLVESRCLQQEYPLSFINEYLTNEIRTELASYPNLPTHMVESGIPPVAFGNVPVSNMRASVIASAAIPIRGVSASISVPPPPPPAAAPAEPASYPDVNRHPRLREYLDLSNSIIREGFRHTRGQSGENAANTSPDATDVSEARDNSIQNVDTHTHTNTEASNAATATVGTTSTNPEIRRTVIHGPISVTTNTTNDSPEDISARHRALHEEAINRHRETLNRVHELRRQQNERDRSVTDTGANTTDNTNTHTSPNTTNLETNISAINSGGVSFAQTLATEVANAIGQRTGTTGGNLAQLAGNIFGSMSSHPSTNVSNATEEEDLVGDVD